jgi:uncharacterized protein
MDTAIPGKYNTLTILRITETGAFLDGGDVGDILLPAKWVPDGAKVDEQIEVFIYFDNLDRLIATTMKPLAVVGEFALLKAAAVNKVGAFLDWGLEKDLLAPFREQAVKMIEENDYLVRVFADPDTGRLAASSKIENFLNLIPAEYMVGDEVELIIWKKTDLGYKAIINQAHEGVIYSSDVFREMKRGEKIRGFIQKIREDDKIDLSLLKPGYEKIDDLSKTLLDILKKHHGFMALTDDSPAEDIYRRLGMSKKNFKKTICKLYKERLIDIEKSGIRLVEMKQE